MKPALRTAVFLMIVTFDIVACDGDHASAARNSLALHSDIQVAGMTQGVTPFITLVQLKGTSLSQVRTIAYTIAPMPNSVSKAVNVSYTSAALARREQKSILVSSTELPVFGLYSGFENSVTIKIEFEDASTETLAMSIATAAYVDPAGIYDHPVVFKSRSPSSSLGFDFFGMKSNHGTPVIVDSDGAIRWVGDPGVSGLASVFINNGFTVGDQSRPTAYRMEFDGSIVTYPLATKSYINFHHNIDVGKVGLLGEMNTAVNIESTISEFSLPAGFGKEWDLAQIISQYMISQGDDPTKFVRPGTDWFHSNATTFDGSDNSVIVSSRENFLVKIDYDSGSIIWILGDPTKYWFTFPSLRAKALSITDNGLYPIGQHATSFTHDGLLMVMNDGYGSIQQPAGEPSGASRSYSAVSAYSIDLVHRTATEVWDFDAGKTIFSPVCGSSYEANDQSLLVNFAAADHYTHVRVMGLDSQHNIVFDFQYTNLGVCDASWNAVPVNFEQMQFI